MRKLLIPLLLILAFGLTIFLAEPIIDSISARRISRMLEEYKTCPSKELCEKLTKFLDMQKVESGLGNEILKELTTPIIKTRSAYSVGKPINFSMTRRFPLHFPNMRVFMEENVETEDGKDLYGGSGSGNNYFDSQPRFLRYSLQPGKPGDYKAQVRYRYELKSSPPAVVNGVRTEQKKPNTVVYQCEFIIPVKLKVVSKEQAESVGQVSSPTLDSKMKEAFSTLPSNWTHSYRTPSGGRKITGGLQIIYDNCPVDATFQMSFRFGNDEVKTSPSSIRIRKGTSGQIHVKLSDFAIEQTGIHHGTLVLSPDFEYAYIDPEIQSIWAGKLEFPMFVTVKQEKK